MTIRREWSGIDHLRMDKFYLLVRRFVHHVFLLLSRNGWDEELSAQFLGVLSEKSLLSADKYQAQGVNYHIAEIFLDEIVAFLPVAPDVFVKFLKPFVSVLEISPDKVLNNKIKRNVFSRLLENGRNYLNYLKQGEGDGVEPISEVEKIGKVALNLKLSVQLFESASSVSTIQGNRKLLFALHEGFLKLEKDLENSGINVSFLPVNGSSEVITLGVTQVDSLKKRKKSKKESASDRKKSKLTEDGCGKAAALEVPSSLASSTVDSPAENLRTNDGENDNLISFDEKLMSNLQKQFDMIAAESGLGTIDSSTSTPIAIMKKKKKSKSAGAHASKLKSSPAVTASASNGDGSVKRVRFSLKNNLVWKPHNPLPPQSLRLPPAATPRGSALKKGVSPGPIKEITPPTVRKVKMKVSSVKKARKSSKSISPAVKRLRKLQNLSV